MAGAHWAVLLRVAVANENRNRAFDGVLNTVLCLAFKPLEVAQGASASGRPRRVAP